MPPSDDLKKSVSRLTTATDCPSDEVATAKADPAYPVSAQVGGLLVLLVIQGLNVYKPQGLTPCGWRKQQEERRRLERGR